MTIEELPLDPASPQAALTGAVLTLLGVPLAWLALRAARRLWPWREERVPAPWGLPELVAVVFGYIALQLLGSMLLGARYAREMALLQRLSQAGPGAGELAAADANPFQTVLVPMLLVHAVTLGLLGLQARFWAQRGGSGASLGLGRGRELRAFSLGSAVWLLSAPLFFGLGHLWPWLLERLGTEYQPQVWSVGLQQLHGPPAWIAGVLAVAAVPFLEELLFRGFLQPLLVRWFGVGPGIVVTAAVFTALHGDSTFLPILALALALGLVREHTGRLSAAWGVHVLHNGVQVALLVFLPEAASP